MRARPRRRTGLLVRHGSSPMLAFAIRRLLEGVVVMLSVALIAFVLFRYVGDPVHQMVGQDATMEDREALRRDLGLNDPVMVQFGRFRGQRSAVRLRHLLSGQAAGDQFDLRTAAGHRRAGPRRCAVCDRARHPDGGLHRHPSRQLAVEAVSDRLARRHLPADIPDRHPADLCLRRLAQRAALVRARRHGLRWGSGARGCSRRPVSRP